MDKVKRCVKIIDWIKQYFLNLISLAMIQMIQEHFERMREENDNKEKGD